MKIGQTIYLKPIGNAKRHSKDIKEAKISKIGRKYFNVEPSYYGRFFIDSMYQDCGEYISDYKAYLSKQEIEEEEEANLLYLKIKKQFESYGNPFTLNQLKKLDDFIKTL